MAEFKIDTKWMAASSGDAEIRATAAMLEISVDDIFLTRNQDIWAETVRDNVFLSAYPLAMWFASSWWRLNHEPMPSQMPGYDWRSTHELSASNHGFVWPKVLFVPDGEVISVRAESAMTLGQSVQYLQSLDTPKAIEAQKFEQTVRNFIHSVLARLEAKSLAHSDLSQLWALVQEDTSDAEASLRRKIEAKLGFDPEECPDPLLDEVLNLRHKLGDQSLSELAPAIAVEGQIPDLSVIDKLGMAQGIIGQPTIRPEFITHSRVGMPWERAVHDARALRKEISNINEPIDNKTLYELLGFSRKADEVLPEGAARISVAIPTEKDSFKFVPRKRNPTGQRFELTRLLGEYLRPSTDSHRWLASTDLYTAHQKYQRAFAAEFLCPLESLIGFLNKNFSMDAIEDAAERFNVGYKTVETILKNNGFINNFYVETGPYRM